jgi:2-polyprenyl-3-methyl-5-hydroxy-6-metoxy-1,4-benzoquinol methylase
MEKLIESKYHNDHVRKYGCYEVHPEKEYKRILSESGILKEECSLTLDVGCGTGAFGLRLARMGFQVIGIDISANSIKIAENMAKKQGLDAVFVVGDIEKMPFRKSSYKFIFCGFVLHHVNNVLPQVLHQIGNVVEDGGKLFLCEPNAHNVGCVVQYNFGKCRTSNENALCIKQLVKLLASIGFANIAVKDMGDVEHLQTDNPTQLRKVLRRLVKMIIDSINKVSFIPGAYFVMQATKMTKSG